MRVSILTPKAFSKRKAMSPERSAFPLSKLDRVGRETRNALAAAVTVSTAGSIISVLMKSPGCGGFFMGIGFLLPASDNPLNPSRKSLVRPDQCERSDGDWR